MVIDESNKITMTTLCSNKTRSPNVRVDKRERKFTPIMVTRGKGDTIMFTYLAGITMSMTKTVGSSQVTRGLNNDANDANDAIGRGYFRGGEDSLGEAVGNSKNIHARLCPPPIVSFI